jgi:hypothetical protein
MAYQSELERACAEIDAARRDVADARLRFERVDRSTPLTPQTAGSPTRTIAIARSQAATFQMTDDVGERQRGAVQARILAAAKQ